MLTGWASLVLGTNDDEVEKGDNPIFRIIYFPMKLGQQTNAFCLVINYDEIFWTDSLTDIQYAFLSNYFDN